ncbi:hypothetical protein B484DRAFT_416412, partial [Ochromonadaceae sp. CCMP2298]
MRFSALIRSHKHLREILGLRGQHLLLGPFRGALVYICKQRLDIVVNTTTWDGVPVAAGEPPYRVEFLSDRIFGQDKVTPINEGYGGDREANRDKLMEIENARGKKVLRCVRRVSGLLMQVAIFELNAEGGGEREKELTQKEAGTGAGVGTEVLLLEDLGDKDLGDKGRGEGAGGAGVGGAGGAGGIRRGPETEAEEAAALAQAPAQAERGLTAPLPSVDRRGYPEDRDVLTTLQLHPPPHLRIVGYDPRSKRKSVIEVPPEAVTEIAGGAFSPYLQPTRRQALAHIIADALVLIFPTGKPFELLLPWSESQEPVSTATVDVKETKISERSSAERVIKRPGRIFRTAMRISRQELLVSLYAHVISAVADRADNHSNRQLIFNFYSPSASEACEVVVKESEAVRRIGQPVMGVEGAERAKAIRRLCRFFAAELLEDITEANKQSLLVVLLPPPLVGSMDAEPPGAELVDGVRPVGIPFVFWPSDTCGGALYRSTCELMCRDPDPEREEGE